MPKLEIDRKGKIFVFSGPSGAGKSTLCNMALEQIEGLSFSISYTTRAPRAGETDGKEYRFIDDARFSEMVENDEFLEHAGVHGKRYGTGVGDIDDMTGAGIDVLLDIDVQGAGQLMERRKDDGVYVFVMPPSLDSCAKRLDIRGDLKDPELKLRLKNACAEIKRAKDYDYVIINDKLTESFEEFKAIILAERIRKASIAGKVERLFNINISSETS